MSKGTHTRLIQRKLERYLSQAGGCSEDFVASYGADLLWERFELPPEHDGRQVRGLLLYERDLAQLRRDYGALLFDLVPFGALTQSPAALKQILPNGRYDLILCNLAFDWIDAGEFIDLLDHLLAPGAVFWFTCFGAASLSHTGSLLAGGGDLARFNPYYDVREIGDALAGAGFRNVVLESSLLTLEYNKAEVMLRDVRRVFGANLHPQRSSGLATGRQLAGFCEQVQQVIEKEGQYVDQLEILVAHGRKTDLPGLHGGIPVRQG